MEEVPDVLPNEQILRGESGDAKGHLKNVRYLRKLTVSGILGEALQKVTFKKIAGW